MPNFSFVNPNSFLYYEKVKDDDDKDDNERRESKRRRYHRTLLEYMQKIVMPSLPKLQNTQFNNTGRRISNIYLFIDQKKMPKAYKIYKCNKCLVQKLESFFDFQKIYPAIKFIHNCCRYSNLQQKQHKDDNDSQIKTLKLQELLLSVIINYRLRSENKLLKMIVLSNNFIENLLSLRLLISSMDIMINKKEYYYQFRWLLDLLENERFVDLGDINSQHWAMRAYNYNNDNSKSSAEGKYVTKLEREELKQFISMTEGTFGLIKFRLDNNKTMYTFSYLPLDNEVTSQNSIIRLIRYQFPNC